MIILDAGANGRFVISREQAKVIKNADVGEDETAAQKALKQLENQLDKSLFLKRTCG